jgi:hypothetical protein
VFYEGTRQIDKLGAQEIIDWHWGAHHGRFDRADEGFANARTNVA